MKQPAHAVKGIIGAGELPLEARVSRLDECRLKQKVGYGQDADPYILLKGKSTFQRLHFEAGIAGVFPSHARTLGLGVSTAAIVENWHGQRFRNPAESVTFKS